MPACNSFAPRLLAIEALMETPKTVYCSDPQSWNGNPLVGRWFAPGAPLTFDFPFPDAPQMTGEVIAFEPERVFALRWGDDVLRFELEPEGDATLLRLRVQIDERDKAARDGLAEVQSPS